MTKEKIIAKANAIYGWMPIEELGIIYDLAISVIKKGDIALEVGSWHGRSAFVTASICKEKDARMISIDCYTGCDSQRGDYTREFLKMDSEQVKKEIQKNLKGLPVEFIQEDSQTAHTKIKDHSLAFCFIDADHFDPAVKNDLDNYLLKVKRGGIFSGHDYARLFPDVIREVDHKFPIFEKRKIYQTIWAVKKETKNQYE
jgi:predicted O-methyltransferase YrrM